MKIRKNQPLNGRYTNQNVTQGELIVNVFDENIAQPLSEVKVDVYGVDKDGTEKQIESLVTDMSGQTEKITLNAPNVELSLEPQELIRPFSLYNLKISSPYFDPVKVNGIEIFDQTTAIQNINMQERRLLDNMAEIINIQENTLWGDFPSKTPEAEVKPLPEATGFVVLDEVVIPEYIIVHEGAPNSGGPDYWVPFKDYIKNVASSEIYSTWPGHSIRANILAILSFTLNRVFTEWYRGQGKSFTITNNTAYDQAFSYGRNIYSEISVVVDELFTNYVTRNGIIQPLFTQYCDGKRVTCPNWLSQWGSAALGEQGKSYLDILKHYYGDIYIDQAKIVSGVPVSYPGSPLSKGSSGASVRTIQNQLNAISNNYPAIPKLRVDGIYGDQTAEGVKEFQRIFSLPQSGVVDLATWYKISHIYVAVSKLATLI